MNNPFLRKAPEQTKDIINKYEVFGLNRNPFPREPGIKVDSPDDRENGSIFLASLRDTEYNSFKRMMIPTKQSIETNTISFLMDYATRKGRGIGKSAFLNYINKEIKKDFGYSLTDNSSLIFSIYISPIPGENYRRFWNISKLILDALIDQNIIALCMCRIRAINGNLNEDVINSIDTEATEILDIIDTIGSEKWLSEHNVNVFNLYNIVLQTLIKSEIDPEFAELLAYNGCNSNKFHEIMNNFKDSFYRKKLNNFVFNDLVKLFKLGGFSNGIILIDELEKIFIPLNSSERRVFTESVRYYFIDGNCENSTYNFYKLLLTIHPYLQELLQSHWQTAGLERFASITAESGTDFSTKYTVYFQPFPVEEGYALPLVNEYISKSIINGDVYQGYPFPFTKESLLEAFKKSDGIPGKYLRLLNHAIEIAIEENWDKIGIKEIQRINIPQPPQEYNNEEISPLTEPKVELKGK